MEILANLTLGFEVAFTIENLVWCLIGTMLGTLIGVLPGIGPMAAMSMLLPLMYGLNNPVTGLIFLAGLYYGTQYGGSTTSILLKMPGETSSLVTAIDGYAMSQQGRGGSALAIAATASFVAGTIATVLVALIGQPLTEVAFLFGPAEYASLMVLGLLASVSLSQGDFLTGLGMVLLGILLGTVGTDINSGITRFTLGSPNLVDGISFAVIAMGVIGLGELVYSWLHGSTQKPAIPKLTELYPNKEEIKKAWPAALRGTAIGSILGLLPGAGAILSSFASYVAEKKISRNPEKFGKGAPEGVAGPEAANNAGAQTSFVPMLSLGIPTTPVMAMMIAAMMINNIQPGPQVMTSHPALFWGLIASMWIGNLMLLILNLPLVGIWVQALRLSKNILFPCIIIFAIIGAHSLNNNWFDVGLLFVFGAIGYVFKRLDCEPSPMAMGFVIGAMFEEHLRRTLSISRGDWMIFLDRPISLTFLLITVILVATSIFFKSRR